MELLFKLTDLETRIPLNLNVLSQGVVPRVMGLGEVLDEWLAHRREVLIRRTEPSAGADRPPPGGARGLPDRLSRPRPGDPDHPQRGRAEAGPDAGVQALRRPGRGDPQHAPPQAPPPRGDGDPHRARHPHQGAGGAPRRWSSPRTSSGRRSPTRSGRSGRLSVRIRQLGKRRTTFAEAPVHAEERHRARHDRARADHRDRLREGLDPRLEGARAGYRGRSPSRPTTS